MTTQSSSSSSTAAAVMMVVLAKEASARIDEDFDSLNTGETAVGALAAYLENVGETAAAEVGGGEAAGGAGAGVGAGVAASIMVGEGVRAPKGAGRSNDDASTEVCGFLSFQLCK